MLVCRAAQRAVSLLLYPGLEQLVQTVSLGQMEGFSSHLLASQFCISPFPYYIALITSQ